MSLYLFSKISTNKAPEIEIEKEVEHDLELAVFMGRMQIFMNKLYFSGIANNAELIEFYLHEIEEAMEEVEHANIIDDGVDISANMKLFGVNQIENLENSLKSGQDFKEAYGVLVTSCNNCHTASKHPFIIIKEPTNPVLDNQVYEKASF
jgi:hypothetical protein